MTQLLGCVSNRRPRSGLAPPTIVENEKTPRLGGLFSERLKGLEPSTFCMASRRSSQLSYSRAVAEYNPAIVGRPTGPPREGR
jgi:hypothetical protein